MNKAEKQGIQREKIVEGNKFTEQQLGINRKKSKGEQARAAGNTKRKKS